MNNLKNLYPCLDSIKKYTTVSYETFVVAYLFSVENLQKLKDNYPWITIIESNEIRGFSENNNLALQQANGKYCFVLNDDTVMTMDVIGGLVRTIEKLPEEVAIVSPNILKLDGTIQYCGRPYLGLKEFVLSCMGLSRYVEKSHNNKYVNQQGVFESYNILGAAFLIKTKIFKQVNWFDEYYFFCPEDIALSTTLNRIGYKCFVNADIPITHYGGMSGKSLSLIQTATKPAEIKGTIHFYTNGNRLYHMLLSVVVFVLTLLQFLYHRFKSLRKHRPNFDYILSVGDTHTLKILFSKKTPKEIFTYYYKNINKE
jgi:GT2 family glycosyltransferase